MKLWIDLFCMDKLSHVSFYFKLLILWLKQKRKNQFCFSSMSYRVLQINTKTATLACFPTFHNSHSCHVISCHIRQIQLRKKLSNINFLTYNSAKKQASNNNRITSSSLPSTKIPLLAIDFHLGRLLLITWIFLTPFGGQVEWSDNLKWTSSSIIQAGKRINRYILTGGANLVRHLSWLVIVFLAQDQNKPGC